MEKNKNPPSNNQVMIIQGRVSKLKALHVVCEAFLFTRGTTLFPCASWHVALFAAVTGLPAGFY
jgi:hypothetical protein